MTDKSLTQNRQAVLDVLMQGADALSAYDILDKLHAQNKKWKPATVYRALNFLIESNLIHRIESEQKFICCDHSHRDQERYFLICNECGQVVEKKPDSALLECFDSLARKYAFELDTPYLEFRGRCASCAPTQNKSK